MHAEERQHECSQRHSEVRAGRLSGRFRHRAYHTVQTRPVSSRSVHHGIFPDVYFYTQSLQRPHERRSMASRREQVSALFFVAWTQRRLTECFPWATEGPNPPKETLTFKKEFFWQTTSGSLPAGLKKTSGITVSLSKWYSQQRCAHCVRWMDTRSTSCDSVHCNINLHPYSWKACVNNVKQCFKKKIAEKVRQNSIDREVKQTEYSIRFGKDRVENRIEILVDTQPKNYVQQTEITIVHTIA